MPLFQSQIKSLPLLSQGKVRDIYAVDEQHLLIVTSDRLSAFDVIMQQAIPHKGAVLNQLSQFWFEKFSHLIVNQLTYIAPESVVKVDEFSQVSGRAMVVKRLQALPIEAVVRGYLIGSGWKDYQNTSSVCGIALPAGLQLASKLPQTIFTPATKAEIGAHDENISFSRALEVCTRTINNPAIDVEQLITKVKDTAIKIYSEAATYALEKGIIIADTKFEFGIDRDGQLHLIDEVLTPDSSRFWASASYQPGSSPSSYDKQFVRDYLETQEWDKTPPPPPLPDYVVSKTADKYLEAYQLLTGKSLLASD